MSFVPLNRSFAEIKIDQSPTLDWGTSWGHRFGEWLGWDDLLKRRRVVLLAEASSGKTEEMREQARLLVAYRHYAFTVRIEDLADSGFETNLSNDDSAAYARWADDADAEAWFFLDSIDEARLNRKSFRSALNRFARELGTDRLLRAHVYVSCRASDWKTVEDRAILEGLLPYPKAIVPPTAVLDLDQMLLGPIFDAKSTTNTSARKKQPESIDFERLFVVQLVPLKNEQRRALAEANGVKDVEAFLLAIAQQGLEAISDRPGDVLELVAYWIEHKKFGPLRDMTERGIARKLREEQSGRADGALLTVTQARHAAERLAAALTLGKSFAIRTLSHDGEPPETSAIDPGSVLGDLMGPAVETLLRRGAFVPSSFNKQSFHHRGTQEYLTATWLRRLLEGGCPVSEVMRLIFAERYGTWTVIPSLRAVAAWLALDRAGICKKIVESEPLVLLKHGDSKSLSIETRGALLMEYAHRDKQGLVSDAALDHRAVWLFSDTRLSSALRQAWRINDRPNFRADLLSFVAMARMRDCADLALDVALDPLATHHLRESGIEALIACDDAAGLEQVARSVIERPEALTFGLAHSMGRSLFPRFVTVDQLLVLVDRSQAPVAFSSGGFVVGMPDLWDRAATRSDQKRLAYGVAELCLSPPHSEGGGISARHYELSKALPEIALREMKRRDANSIEPGLIRLLMATERVPRPHRDDATEFEELAQLVREDPILTRTLFWGDVAEVRERHRSQHNPASQYLLRYFIGFPLWKIQASDVVWLQNDCERRPDPVDKRAAFSAIYEVSLEPDGATSGAVLLLEQLARGDLDLSKDLVAFNASLKKSEIEIDFEKRRVVAERKQALQTEADKQSWRDLRDLLVKAPTLLREAASRSGWGPGQHRLLFLTKWLASVTSLDLPSAAMKWALLADVFSPEVAAEYCAGMALLWRSTPAERPRRSDGNQITTKYTSILSIAGLNIEVLSRTDWYASLADAELTRASEHACLAEQGYPVWFSELLTKRPQQAEPVFIKAVRFEIANPLGHNDLLNHFARATDKLPPTLAQTVVQAIRRKDPPIARTLELCLRILAREPLDAGFAAIVAALSNRRLNAHLAAGSEEFARHYQALRLLVTSEAGVFELEERLQAMAAASEQERVEEWLAYLFDRDERAMPSRFLQELNVPALARLVTVMYRYVRREDDQPITSSRILGRRDHAESARNVVLTALSSRTGADAHVAMTRLAGDPAQGISSLRLHEIAHEMLERDTEPAAWTTAEVLRLERNSVAPIKSGADLLRVTVGILADINQSFTDADASSGHLVTSAADEEAVQRWLAEQFELRSKGRYQTHRETQIALGDRPDIVLTSTSVAVQVAIELKHGGKGWSSRKLRSALQTQLAEKYLKPAERRHGILVVTRHTGRGWKDPDTGKAWTFQEVMQWLASIAHTISANRIGAIEVRAVGLAPDQAAHVKGGKRNRGKKNVDSIAE